MCNPWKDTWEANSFTISSTGCVLVGLGSHDKVASIGGLKPQHLFSQLWCLGSPRLRCRQVRTLPTAPFLAGSVSSRCFLTWQRSSGLFLSF